MKRTSLAVMTVAVGVFAAGSASAQDTSTGGTGTVSTEGTATATLPKPPPPAPAAPAAAAPAAPTAEGPSDHEQVVGHLAVGYFGTSQVPLAANPDVTAPFVGVRYWMNDKIGLDLALGFRTQSGSTETVAGSNTITTDQPGVLAGGVKAGVPLALAYGKHYTFTVVPELLLAGATRTVKGQGNPPPPDQNLTGSRIELGVRAGAEIQFGFIGIPQLALQGSIGLGFTRRATKSSTEVNGTTNSSAQDNLSLGTTVQSDPWALFTNNISALYYF